MSIYCPYCGSELPDDARYCNHCGKEMPSNNSNTPMAIVPSSNQKSEDQSKTASIPNNIQSSKSSNKKNPNKTTIIVFVVVAILLLGGVLGITLLVYSSSNASNPAPVVSPTPKPTAYASSGEPVLGIWTSTGTFYDSDAKQYATVVYKFSNDYTGTQSRYNSKTGNKYYEKPMTWSGSNTMYLIVESNTKKSYTFITTGNTAKSAYGLSFQKQGSSGSPTVSSTKYSTVSPTIKATATPTQKKDSYIERNYNWEYNGYKFKGTYSFPKSTYDYYKSVGHGNSNLAKYATDSTNREIVSRIADSILGETKDFSEYDKVMSVVSFVQSLPYTSDSVTTGHDDYPRYPIETLVDNGGDCEDTAILTVAILREMGYGCALLKFDNHVAVGVKGGEGVYGSYFTKDGVKYYYLETTGKNWDIGEIPDAYKSKKASVIVLN